MYEDFDFSRKLKVAVVCGDKSGPYYHDFGVPIPFFHAKTGLQFTCFEVLQPAALKDFDIIHLQRQYAPETLIILRNLVSDGKVCISLVDDNVWELPKSNPAYTTYQGAVLERFQSIIAESYAVTTSTQYLKSLISRFNTNCYIFRNLVDPSIERFSVPGRDNPNEIRIGWTLTPHHADDAQYAMPALGEICKKYPQVKLVFMGWLPPYVKDNIRKERYEYYDFVPVDAFYACFGALDLDIGIAPLGDSGFNMGKTHRKFSEYGIFKIPCILSPVGPYLGLEELGLCLQPKGNRHDEWIRCLSLLIKYPEEGKRLAENAYRWVLQNQDINTFIIERAQTYYDIYTKATGLPRHIVWEGDMNAAERIQALGRR